MAIVVGLSVLLGLVLSAFTPALVNKCLGMVLIFFMSGVVALFLVVAMQVDIAAWRVVFGILAGLSWGVIVFCADLR